MRQDLAAQRDWLREMGVMSDVFGVSGILMLHVLAEGNADVAAMADLAKRRLRRKIDQLALTLDGQLAEHQRRCCQVDGWDGAEAA